MLSSSAGNFKLGGYSRFKYTEIEALILHKNLYSSVTVICWGYDIKGLHKNDFIMASKTSGIFYLVCLN